jgi:glycogen(starch) synthase
MAPRLYGLLASAGVEKEHVYLVPPGVNPSLFDRPLEDPFSGVGRPRVLFVGRLAPQKGVSTLVAAAAVLEHPNAQILLVGDGPERKAPERQARRIRVGDRVSFLGVLRQRAGPVRPSRRIAPTGSRA